MKLLHDEEIPNHYKIVNGEDEIYAGSLENCLDLKDQIEQEAELQSQKIMVEPTYD